MVERKDTRSVVVIGVEGGLCKFKGHSEATMLHDITSPCELWHRRLAHLNYKSLPHVSKVVTGLPNMKIDHEGVYKGCAKREEYQELVSKERHQDIRDIGACPFRCV